MTYVIVPPRIIDRGDGTFSVLEADFPDPGCTSGSKTVGFKSRESAQQFIDELIKRDPDSMVREYATMDEYMAAQRIEIELRDLPNSDQPLDHDASAA